MASVDIAGIAREHDRRAIEGGARILDLERTGCQQARRAAVRGDGIEMQPAVALRREHELVARGPVELRVGAERVKHAAGAARRAEHLERLAVRDADDADRPRRADAVRPDCDFVVRGRDAQECDAGAVR